MDSDPFPVFCLLQGQKHIYILSGLLLYLGPFEVPTL